MLEFLTVFALGFLVALCVILSVATRRGKKTRRDEHPPSVIRARCLVVTNADFVIRIDQVKVWAPPVRVGGARILN